MARTETEWLTRLAPPQNRQTSLLFGEVSISHMQGLMGGSGATCLGHGESLSSVLGCLGVRSVATGQIMLIGASSQDQRVGRHIIHT